MLDVRTAMADSSEGALPLAIFGSLRFEMDSLFVIPVGANKDNPSIEIDDDRWVSHVNNMIPPMGGSGEHYCEVAVFGTVATATGQQARFESIESIVIFHARFVGVAGGNSVTVQQFERDYAL
jgi:hypothetical protein